MEVLVKVTSKGQVTIPKKIRDLLGSRLVKFKVVNGKVMLEPVRDMGGIFKKYAQGSLSREKEREVAWQKVADEYRSGVP